MGHWLVGPKHENATLGQKQGTVSAIGPILKAIDLTQTLIAPFGTYPDGNRFPIRMFPLRVG